jgi:hypothetical protein
MLYIIDHNYHNTKTDGQSLFSILNLSNKLFPNFSLITSTFSLRDLKSFLWKLWRVNFRFLMRTKLKWTGNRNGNRDLYTLFLFPGEHQQQSSSSAKVNNVDFNKAFKLITRPIQYSRIFEKIVHRLILSIIHRISYIMNIFNRI